MAGTDPVADLKTLHRALLARRRQIAALAAQANENSANIEEDEGRAARGYEQGQTLIANQAAIEAVVVAIADEERIARDASPQSAYQQPRRGGVA